VILQALKPLGRKNQRCYCDLLRTAELDAIQAAEGRRRLILGSDVLADLVLLHVDGAHRELALAGHLMPQRMERVQQAYRKGGAGTQAGARRQIGVVNDVHAAFNLHGAKALAHGGVLNLVD
jgi:hypothetical protein